MSQPFLGEVKIVPYNYAQKGWAFCNGQLLPIAQNQALFSLLGTTYGGNGTTTFGLPNLSGRTPIHWGTGTGIPSVTVGQSGGEATHTLNTTEMATHVHQLYGSSNNVDVGDPGGGLLGVTGSTPTYLQSSANSTLVPGSIGSNGGGQPHDNMQPYLALNFVIALQGIFPSRN